MHLKDNVLCYFLKCLAFSILILCKNNQTFFQKGGRLHRCSVIPPLLSVVLIEKLVGERWQDADESLVDTEVESEEWWITPGRWRMAERAVSESIRQREQKKERGKRERWKAGKASAGQLRNKFVHWAKLNSALQHKSGCSPAGNKKVVKSSFCSWFRKKIKWVALCFYSNQQSRRYPAHNSWEHHFSGVNKPINPGQQRGNLQ